MAQKKAERGKIALVIAIGGVCLTAIALVLGLVDYFSSKKEKVIEYSLESMISLADIHEDVREEIELKYHGNVISDLSKVTILIRNTGDLPIPNSDVMQPLTISLDTTSKIVDTKIETKPNNMIVTAHVDSTVHNFVIGFDALDVNDEIETDIYFTGPLLHPPELKTRILGIKDDGLKFIDKSIRTASTGFPPRPTSWESFLLGVVGSFVLYFARFGNMRIRLVQYEPRRGLILLFTDYFIYIVCGGILAMALSPDTTKEAYLLGVGWFAFTMIFRDSKLTHMLAKEQT